MNWSEKNIFFEQTKMDKIERIVGLECTHYVDDLSEILELLPEGIKKNPLQSKRLFEKAKGAIEIKNWKDLQL